MTTTASTAPPSADTGPANALSTEIQQLTRTMHVLKNGVVTARDGVPWSTYLLLFHLISGGPQRAGALAEAAGTDPSTVSRQIDWLVRSGLVERQADPSDGRATLLVATDAGVATQQQMRAGRDRMMAGVLSGWRPQDVQDLTRLLGRLNADLTDQLPQILASLQRRASSPPADSATTADRTPTADSTPKDLS